MQFNIIASLVLVIGLVAATPTPEHSLEKREDRPVWRVRAFTDDLCNEDNETGTWSHDQEKCENLDNFSVDVLGITGEVDGTILGAACSWQIMAHRELDCEGALPEDRPVSTGICRNVGSSFGSVERNPIKSFSVAKFGPCD
ncbi:hypothetical protein EDB82DRAFT_523113 [Fusarium venenatum]|uniref:uncharacterized protein n=1 Tax=Fusarium venenatum TaxID=56646 RepID=UPI001DD55336|nr:hypothetical protein EDB82DRAFT_523113 [Fusarium venenatum]